MKFIQAHIYGFGKWVDTTFDFTSSSFLTYFGENESGKSTLQAFLSFMLFGLPPRQRQFFQPKHSSRFGGSLTIENEAVGQFTIERTAHEFACYLQNEATKDEAWLNETLHDLTRDTYESIYSFSALDLSEIQEMKVQQLNQVLFSVGLTGSTNIYQMERELETKIGQLYKAKGWKPQLNEQLTSVRKKYEQLIKAKKEEETYTKQQEERLNIEKSLEKAKEQLSNIKAKGQMKEKLLQVLPLRKQYEQLQVERENYGEIRPFPEDGLARLQQLKEHYLPLQSEEKVLQNQYDEYDKELKELQEATYEETIFLSLQSLAEKRIEIEEMQGERVSLNNEIKRLEEALEDKNQLIPLKQEDIADVVLPFHLETVVAEIQALEEELTKELSWLEEELAYTTKEVERLTNEIEKTAQLLLPNATVQTLKNENARYEQMQREKAWSEENDRAVQKLHEKNRQQAKTTAFVAAFFTTLFMALTFWQKETFYIVFAIASAGLAFWQWRQSNRSMMLEEKLSKDPDSALDAAQLLENERLLKKDEEIKTALHLLENEKKHASFQQIQLEEKLYSLRERESHLKDRIETERYQYPFLTNIQPKYWVKLIEIVRDMKGLLTEKEALLESLARIEAKLTPVEEELHYLAKDLVEESLTIDQVRSLYEAEKAKHDQIARLAAEKEKKAGQLQAVKEKISVYEVEKRALFTVAQTEEEEEFYRIAYDNEKITRVETELSAIKGQIEQLFHEDEMEALWQSKASMAELEAEIKAWQIEEEKLSEEIATLHRTLASIDLQIEQLEESGTLSNLHFSYEIEKSVLNELAEQYAVLKVAQTALEAAKENYQKRYFNRVIEQTAAYFSYITNGKYINIYAPTEKELFQVEANNNIRYTIEELSKGTIDQVYVSLRLAMNTVMQEKVQMPLMIDDAFVHFDEGRKERMIQLLEKISASQQVIFFTCVEDRVISGRVKVQEELKA